MKRAPSIDKLQQKQQRLTRRKGDLAPNPEMWAILEKNNLLSDIIEDFYQLVFADERLAPFFADSTPRRARDKQFLFMKAIFTGEKCYFGERPRNAHNWMVISDELFDYREVLMEKVLRQHGLTEDLILQWRAVDEIYRKQIVKTEAFAKKIDGIELPVGGYEKDIIESGSMCDACEHAIDAGNEVYYHLRTGKTYCLQCKPNE